MKLPPGAGAVISNYDSEYGSGSGSGSLFCQTSRIRNSVYNGDDAGTAAIKWVNIFMIFKNV